MAERLAARPNLAVILSLAGRTAKPAPQPVPVRIGGFGGVPGLLEELARERIDVVIDATHPYAATISVHALEATRSSAIPLLILRRPPWEAISGDRWTEVAEISAAVRSLGVGPRRVFLALGRKELAPFLEAPQHHYLIRSVDPVDPPLAVPDANYVTGRGPFSEADDCALLEKHAIEVVVAKNSGGPATYGKIAAARMLGLDVIMLRRPERPKSTADVVETVGDAVKWLDHTLAH